MRDKGGRGGGRKRNKQRLLSLSIYDELGDELGTWITDACLVQSVL